MGGSSVSCSGFDSRHGSGPARFRTLALLPFSFPGWAEEASVISGDDPLLRARVQLPIRTSSLVQPPLQMSSSSQDFPLPAGGQWCNSTHLLHAPVSQSGRGPCLRRMSVPVRVRPGVPAPSAGPAGWASQPLGTSTCPASGPAAQGSLVTLVRLQPPTPASLHFREVAV